MLKMAGSTSISNLRRVVVGLKGHDKCEKPRMADFLTCLVHHFSPNKISTTISCGTEDDMIVLYPSTCDKDNSGHRPLQSVGNLGTDYETVTLHHSPECPLWKLPDFESTAPTVPQNNRGINVGVAVLLESSDSHVLLTQRSDKMRTFPRAWVPPGGNLEMGESPLQGALREMEEEAGLALNPSNCNASLFCLWESVYPPMLPFGLPRSHHLVLYFLAKSNETWEDLQAKIKLDPEEVKACTWLTRNNVNSLFSAPPDTPQKVKQFVIDDNGEIQLAELDIHKTFHNELWQGKDIYTGSQLVLTKWLESHKEKCFVSSKI
ncbi:Nucleoside diphosphate-linked moiety X motif 17 [Blattella germanica]|nr:Nucleoside diphosphate-linked moiety X motif 17 [Blattella germanica]